MRGNVEEALRFLRWLRPEGPWILTAIPVGGGLTTTVTFEAAQIERMRKWIEEFDGQQNIYFMVNPARGPLTSKAKKEDVEAVTFLHVDVDPAKGEPLEVEQPRILDRLQSYNPPPSAIVFSGGGYQGFWRLDAPLFIGGSPEAAANGDAYNQQLELELKGDNCFNVDRIMRVPGTVNIPDERKKKKGRTEVVASIIYLADPDQRVYPLSTFMPAPQVQTDEAGIAPASIKIAGNLARVDLDELPVSVSPRTRSLIREGDDPDNPTKYASRSEVVWAVLCDLIRNSVAVDMIAAILLDKDYGISAHVRSQPRPREYLARQIRRAQEEVIHPMLREMNEKHAVISDYGGRCRVISETLDRSLPVPSLRISKQSFEDFRNRYSNRRIQVGAKDDGTPIYMAAGKWWLDNPLRRQYDSIVFVPGHEVANAYNLWRGFACEAIPGEAHQPFLQHVHDNICQGNEVYYDYIVRWMARAVQYPAHPGEVAIILRGGQGTGKGTFASGFGSLFGRHFLHVSSAKHLVGQFNAHQRDCLVLFADEAFFAGDRSHESTLKTLITEETATFEAKGVDAESGPNYIHLIMASNAHWVVPAGADERRFFMLDVGEDKKQDTAYFATIREGLDAGGRESLLHFLLTLSLEGFSVFDVPATAALQEQKDYSLTTEEAWWADRLINGGTIATDHGWRTEIQKRTLQLDYLRYCEEQRVQRRMSAIGLGRTLARFLPPGYPRSVQRVTTIETEEGTARPERVYWYELPTLEECRYWWSARYGPQDWPEVSDVIIPFPGHAPRPGN